MALKKGSVVNIEKTVRSIECSVEEAKLMSGVNIAKATIGIAGNHIYSFNSTGVVAIKGNEITQDDIDRVIEAAKAVVIPSDREILHVIAQEYKVDNTPGIKDPIGMCGVRLEAKVHIVTGAISLIQNLVKCVEQAGVKTENIVLQPIASSEAVILSEEKEMGVVLVDIGGGTTDVAIWKDNSLLHSQIIPVGGNHFTNDLAVSLKVPHPEAERIKMNHGSVLVDKMNETEHVSIQGINGSPSREILVNHIAEILGARAHELFQLVQDIIDEQNIEEELTGGIIITGGGSLIKGLPQLAEFSFARPTRIGFPVPFGGMTNVMQNPKYSTVLGLLLDAGDNVKKEEKIELIPSDIISRFSRSIKSVFRELF